MNKLKIIALSSVLIGLILIASGAWMVGRAISDGLPSADNSDSRMGSLAKGHAFEKYAVELFPSNKYELLEWRSDKKANNHFPKSNTYPDLVFLRKNDSRKFALETKWRAKEYSKIKWSYPAQIERYREYSVSKDIPVFVLLGIGGTPDNPNEIFLFSLDTVKKPIVDIGYLKKSKFHLKKISF